MCNKDLSKNKLIALGMVFLEYGDNGWVDLFNTKPTKALPVHLVVRPPFYSFHTKDIQDLVLHQLNALTNEEVTTTKDEYLEDLLNMVNLLRKYPVEASHYREINSLELAHSTSQVFVDIITGMKNNEK